MIKYVFGSKFSREEKLSHYLKTKKVEILKLEDCWPQKVKSSLKELFMKDPLSAKLGEAWVRQKITKNDNSLLPSKNHFPWEQKEWWRKERISQALLQIAAGNQQSLMWACKEDIKNLSSGNILIFTNICKAMWDAWLRSLTTEEKASTHLLPNDIPHSVQNAGIREASRDWYNKIGTDVGDGSSRKLFVKYVSERLRDALRSDKKMTYPGHNGFTVPLQELDLDENNDIKQFLQESVDYGVLVDREHNPKFSGWGKSRKFYPVQVLSPYFQLPEKHTKEPKYIRCAELRNWLLKAGLNSFKTEQTDTTQKKIKKTSSDNSPFLPFFDQENDNG